RDRAPPARSPIRRHTRNTAARSTPPGTTLRALETRSKRSSPVHVSIPRRDLETDRIAVARTALARAAIAEPQVGGHAAQYRSCSDGSRRPIGLPVRVFSQFDTPFGAQRGRAAVSERLVVVALRQGRKHASRSQ